MSTKLPKKPEYVNAEIRSLLAVEEGEHKFWLDSFIKMGQRGSFICEWQQHQAVVSELNRLHKELKSCRTNGFLMQYACDIHGIWNANKESGCPSCMREAREEIARLKKELEACHK